MAVRFGFGPFWSFEVFSEISRTEQRARTVWEVRSRSRVSPSVSYTFGIHSVSAVRLLVDDRQALPSQVPSAPTVKPLRPLPNNRRPLGVRYLWSMDESLLTAFRAGDPDAIRAVYTEFAGPVATVARSVVGNDHLVDDIVQQTFTKAWQAAQSFDPSRRFAPWLYSIARHTAIDAARAERRPTRGDHEPETDVAVKPAVSMEQTWEAYEVRRAVETLPPEEQQVVKLSHTLRLTHPEIAEHLGIPLGTVKSRSHRAHRRLLAALAHLRNDDVPPPLRADERRNVR